MKKTKFNIEEISKEDLFREYLWLRKRVYKLEREKTKLRKFVAGFIRIFSDQQKETKNPEDFIDFDYVMELRKKKAEQLLEETDSRRRSNKED